MKKFRGIIWGLAALAVGVIYGGNALGVFDINLFFDGWWTLFLIIPSAIGLITDRQKTGNLMVLFVGIMLLLASQEVLSFENAGKVILAGFLILLGLSIIYKSIFKKNSHRLDDKDDPEDKDDDDDDDDEDDDDEDDLDNLHTGTHLSVFSGEELNYDGEEFKSAKLYAIFGGIELDLRKAVIKDGATIKTFCLFGGVDIIVPENINIKSNSNFIFGGIDDTRNSSAKKSSSKNPTIYLDTTGGFGGVEVEN